jgi:hypothetical protein
MGMRRIALVVALLAGLAGGPILPQRAGASCAFIVVWHDRAYLGSGGGPAQASPGGTMLDGAVEPGCNDTGGADEHPTAVAARSIPDIPSAVAIFSQGSIFVGSGYFIEHYPVVSGGGGVRVVDETRGCALGGPVRITGRVQLGLGLISVSVDDSTVHLRHLASGMAQIFPDGHTRFDGLSRNGFPYIGEGQRVRVDARFCKVPGSEGTKIVGRRITPAGPIVPPSTAEDVLGADWRGRPDAVSRATRGHALAVAIVVLLAALGIGTALVNHRRRSLPPGTG